MNFKNVLKPLAKGKEREIYDTSGLAKKIHYDMKILDIEKKYFTTSDYNLRKYDSTIFCWSKLLWELWIANFLISPPIHNTFTFSAGLTDTVVEWQSQGMWTEKSKPSSTANHGVSPKLRWINNSRIRVEFKQSCLKQGKVTFTPTNAVNLSNVY